MANSWVYNKEQKEEQMEQEMIKNELDKIDQKLQKVATIEEKIELLQKADQLLQYGSKIGITNFKEKRYEIQTKLAQVQSQYSQESTGQYTIDFSKGEEKICYPAEERVPFKILHILMDRWKKNEDKILEIREKEKKEGRLYVQEMVTILIKEKVKYHKMRVDVPNWQIKLMQKIQKKVQTEQSEYVQEFEKEIGQIEYRTNLKLEHGLEEQKPLHWEQLNQMMEEKTKTYQQILCFNVEERILLIRKKIGLITQLEDFGIEHHSNLEQQKEILERLEKQKEEKQKQIKQTKIKSRKEKEEDNDPKRGQ